MKRTLAALWVAGLFSVPLWMTNQYVLHILVVTGIFIVAAMSLNLLLGYTGQLSLGHVAFFGIGAYASSLVSLGFNAPLAPGVALALDPQPVWCGMLAAVVVAGACGWFIGKISFRVRGAYFVIVSISFAEVHAPGRGELGRSDAGPDGAQQHPAAHPVVAGRGRTRLLEASRRTTGSSSASRSSRTSSSAGSSARAPAAP